MTEAKRLYSAQDEADRLVDMLLANPGRAEDIKSQLRRRLRDDTVVHVAPSHQRRPVVHDEVEEMWDNVPV